MADKQQLTCPECGEQFEFDPNRDEKVVTSLNESMLQKRTDVEVVAYLSCPNGHVKRYKVKKDYK